MTHKKTFQIGGIHLDKHKISALNPIIDAGVPELVYIPVRQHIGAPAVLQKTKGDKVKIGTLLARQVYNLNPLSCFNAIRPC